jgi:hypothetical protein
MIPRILENKKSFCCEVCGGTIKATRKTTAGTINEFHKDGTIKIHYTCSNHIGSLQ